MSCYEVVIYLLCSKEFEGVLKECDGVLSIEALYDESDYCKMFEELYHKGHIKIIQKNNANCNDFKVEVLKFNSLNEILEYCKKDFDLEYKEVNCDC